MGHSKRFYLPVVSSLAFLAAGCGSGKSVGHTPQDITFTNPGTQTVGVPATLSATSKSGLAVSLVSASPAVCTVSGTMVTFETAGTCTINASSSGNSTYAASQATQSFTVNPAIGPNTTIYVVGYGISSTSTPGDYLNLAAMWRLTSGNPVATATLLPTPGGMTNAQAVAIALSGSDIYVAGIASNATNQAAVYWLNNGPAITLPSSMTLSQTNAIAVSGGNVYIVGSEENSAGTARAVLWVNGTHTLLPPPSGKTYAGASAIAISGGNVYVAGIAFNTDEDETAALWVNGVPSILPPPSGLTGDYFANGLAVAGGNVYVSGTTIPNSGGTTALFWQNGGAAMTLPIPSGDTAQGYGAEAVAVSGSDVYVAGGGVSGATGNSTAAYWLNGTGISLPLPTNAVGSPVTSFTGGIGFSGSDVYVVGSWGKYATYWVNGGAGTLLPMPSGTSQADAIAITVATQ
jgi:hypothetical protein